MKLLIAILVCTNFVFAARADERTSKSINSNIAAAPGSSQATSDANASARPTSEDIQRLVRELGSAQYTTRRAAATELRQMGSEAFDVLFAATDDADPEVAASANYLLKQIPVRWVQPNDPTEVRVAMRQFAQETETVRTQRVDQLDNLEGGAGAAALCRIARFDRSPLVARKAALAIIEPDEKPNRDAKLDPDVVDRELGSSSRAPAKWLRQYLVQLRDPSASVGGWKQLIDRESARLEKNAGDTSTDVVLGLYWNLADLYRQIGDGPALNGALDRMMALAPGGSDDTLVDLLAWLTENKSWDVLDAFLTKHEARLEQSKRPLYYAALARAKQGKNEQAEQLAAKAAALAPQQNSFESISIAKDLEERNKFDWAVREYHRSIDKQPAESLESIVARNYLSSLLHDYEHEKEAADILEPLVKAVHGDGRFSQLYTRTREYYAEQRISLPSAEEIAAHYHFYRACQYQNEKDFQRAKGELDLAINFDSTDADVLIAMYHLPQTDAQWHDAALARIHKLVQQFQREIDQHSSDASPYNQWAWLVSNTEGDFQQAIRYSHRSLDLNTHGDSGAASFLDTLGRCYYAAGDYDNAVKYERQAIAKIDYLQVMKRQLALFEKALAHKKAAANKNAAAESN
ncbi:MAG TPA: tetratricopeptide repeat protein [Lacipirellulaceae bacterium]|nr:tetratricopeptide repeat protein [Lacipirellulaceae bacterium]